MLTPLQWTELFLNQIPYLAATVAGLLMLSMSCWLVDRFWFPHTLLRELLKRHALGVPMVLASLILGVCYIIGKGVGG